MLGIQNATVSLQQNKIGPDAKFFVKYYYDEQGILRELATSAQKAQNAELDRRIPLRPNLYSYATDFVPSHDGRAGRATREKRITGCAAVQRCMVMRYAISNPRVWCQEVEILSGQTKGILLL